jgi:hypothetical protein
MKSTATLPRARTERLVIRELDDETLVYDIERDKAHCLNRMASLVWNQCDGKITAAKAANALGTTLGISIDEDIVWLAVKQLRSFHLVDGTEKSPSVSRRALVLKYAPAALALPVIMSISAPGPAQAASCAMNGGSCATLPCCPGLGLVCQPGSPPTCRPG